MFTEKKNTVYIPKYYGTILHYIALVYTSYFYEKLVKI